MFPTSIYRGTFFLTSQREDKIIRAIDDLNEGFYKFFPFLDNVYEYVIAVNPSFSEVQQQLKNLLTSDAMKKFKKIAEENGGIAYPEATGQNQFPHNKVCIQIKHDSDNEPIELIVFFKGMNSKRSLSIDLSSFTKASSLIREHGQNLVYLSKSYRAEINEEFDNCFESLRYQTNAARNEVINTFNKKWKGMIEMHYCIDTDAGKGTLTIKDKHGLMNCSRSINHIYIEKEIDNKLVTTTMEPKIELVETIETRHEKPKNNNNRCSRFGMFAIALAAVTLAASSEAYKNYCSPN